jgi:methionine sulfoxide reductase heme-binding subunit
MRSFIQRHLIVGVLAFLLVLPFWYGRLNWDPEMRLWRAIGDSSVLLLFATMSMGPLARLWSPAARLLPWRRETGIWFGITAFVHTYLVLDGWVRWELARFFGYEFIPQLGRLARLEPGFGLTNLLGIVAVFLTIFLVATSSNWAINRLGSSAWKWLQYGSYTIFYLVVLHTLYFLFIHYTVSFHRQVPDDPNWFRYPFLILSLLVLALQGAAFVKVVASRSSGPRALKGRRPGSARESD